MIAQHPVLVAFQEAESMTKQLRKETSRDYIDAMKHHPIGMPFPGRQTRIATRVTKGLLLVALATLSSLFGIPLHPASASPSPKDKANILVNGFGSQLQKLWELMMISISSLGSD